MSGEEFLSLWIVLGTAFALGNGVYWISWKLERDLRELKQEREARRRWR